MLKTVTTGLTSANKETRRSLVRNTINEMQIFTRLALTGAKYGHDIKAKGATKVEIPAGVAKSLNRTFLLKSQGILFLNIRVYVYVCLVLLDTI